MKVGKWCNMVGVYIKYSAPSNGAAASLSKAGIWPKSTSKLGLQVCKGFLKNSNTMLTAGSLLSLQNGLLKCDLNI